MQPVAGQLARGALWVFATRILVSLVGLASTLLLARLLMPDDFGLVAIAMTIAVILTSMTDLSLAQALVQHKEPDRSHYDTAWTFNVLRAFILAIATAATSEWIAYLYSDPRLANILYVIAVGTFIAGLGSPMMASYTRHLIFWQDFVINVTQKLAAFTVAATIALIWQSYWALVAATIVSPLTAVIASYILAPYRPHLSFSRAQDLLSFSIWLALGQAINTLNWRSDQLVVGYILGKSPLGYYNLGSNLANLPTQEMTAPIAQTLFPAFSRIRHDPARLRNAYVRAQGLLCFIALPTGFGFAAIAEPLVELALGDKWLPTVFIIQFLSCMYAVQTLSSMAQPLAMALGSTRKLFQRDLINLGIRLPSVMVGLIYGGLEGAIIARFASGILSTIINMMLVQSLCRLSLWHQIISSGRALASTALMFLCVYVFVNSTPNMPLHWVIFICLFGGAFIYAIATLLIWVWAKRPDGPERAMFAAARHLIGR